MNPLSNWAAPATYGCGRAAWLWNSRLYPRTCLLAAFILTADGRKLNMQTGEVL